MRPWSKPLILSVVVCVVVAGTVGLVAAARQAEHFCNTGTEGMGAEKREAFDRYCAMLEKAPNAPAAAKNPTRYQKPSEGWNAEKAQKAREHSLFGVIEGLPLPPWMNGYQIANAWLGEDKIVYAGSAMTDPNQGVVAVATRFVGPAPEKVGVLLTPEKSGPLQVSQGDGKSVVLVAENGSRYVLELDSMILRKQ